MTNATETKGADMATDETFRVVETFRCGIRTRYYGPGNVRGSRVVAWRADDPSPRADDMSVSVSWDYALGVAGNHGQAVEQYIAGHIAAGHGWEGTYVLAAGHDGYLAILVPKGLHA